MFAGLCGIFFMLTAERLIAFVQIAIPIWFILAMSDRLISLTSAVELANGQTE